MKVLVFSNARKLWGSTLQCCWGARYWSLPYYEERLLRKLHQILKAMLNGLLRLELFLGYKRVGLTCDPSYNDAQKREKIKKR